MAHNPTEANPSTRTNQTTPHEQEHPGQPPTGPRGTMEAPVSNTLTHPRNYNETNLKFKSKQKLSKWMTR